VAQRGFMKISFAERLLDEFLLIQVDFLVFLILFVLEILKGLLSFAEQVGKLLLGV
jgi:hypothetical protein